MSSSLCLKNVRKFLTFSSIVRRKYCFACMHDRDGSILKRGGGCVVI